MRPHELIAIIARLGAGRKVEDLGEKRLTGILKAIMDNPRIRLRFCCYRGEKYNGCAADACRGVAQSMLWDMEIIYRINRNQSESQFVARPVITGYAALQAIIGKIHSIENICVYSTPTGPAWRGLTGVTDGDYVRGRAKIKDLLAQILPGHNACRTDSELADIRRKFAERIYSADCLRLFPQHLLFVIAYFGRCSEMMRGEIYTGDSMYEVGVAMRRRPDIPVMLVPEHCMLCPTCRGYDPEGAGNCHVVPDDLKPAENIMAGMVELNLLRTLGLEFYQQLPAVEMIQLAFDKLALDHGSFTYNGSPPAAWAYARGKYAGVGFMEAYRNARGVIARVRNLMGNPDVLAVLSESDQNHVNSTLEKAERAPNARERYLALIDEPFNLLWKFHCEKAAQYFARLPGEIRRERREQDGRPVIAAERLAPDADNLETVAGQWKPGMYSTGFVTIGNRPAIAETAVKAVLGKDRLYIGILCAERDMRELKADFRVGPALIEHQRWSKHFGELDDSVAIMLSPENNPAVCCQFSFNARGVKAAKTINLAKNRQNGDEWIYETEWRVLSGVDNGLWRGTVEIPFDCLPVKFKSDINWRLNVVRFVRNESLFPHTWARLTRGCSALDSSLYEIEKFGWLTSES